jgi:hypothetical protein
MKGMKKEFSKAIYRNSLNNQVKTLEIKNSVSEKQQTNKQKNNN